MATTGAKIAGTGTSVARGSNTAWTNPGNITANDGTVASCNSGTTGSAYLRASNFGFAIPAGSVINGITAVVDMAESSSGTETVSVQLVNDAAALFGTAKTFVASGTTLTLYTSGSGTDKWGTTTLTPALVNDVDFGVYVWYTTSHNTTVDYISINIDYTPPVTGSISATETGSDTASASGKVAVSGALSATETGSDTAAFNGLVTDPPITGSLAATETGSDTASFTGEVSAFNHGSLAATEVGSDTAAVTAKVLVSGSLAVTETGTDTASLSGSVLVTGSLAAQESGSDSAALSGQVIVSGQLSANETGSDAASFAGQVLISGALLSAEVDNDSASVAGYVRVSGSLSTNESGNDTASFDGDVAGANHGQLVATETGADTASVSGQVLVAGSLAATETGLDTAALSGLVRISGSLAATDSGADWLTGTGKVLVQGSAAASEISSDTAAISGVTVSVINGSLAASETGSDTAVFRSPVIVKKAGGRNIGFTPVREVTVAVAVTPRVSAKSARPAVRATQQSVAQAWVPGVHAGSRAVRTSVTWSSASVVARNGARGSTAVPQVSCGTTVLAGSNSSRVLWRNPVVQTTSGQIVLADVHGAKQGTVRPKVKTVLNPTDEELAVLAAMLSRRRQARVLTQRK